jgi:hypothetical protein
LKINELTNPQIIAAVEAFLCAMRREYYQRHPETEECRVPNWNDITPADRAVLFRSMRTALLSLHQDTLRDLAS